LHQEETFYTETCDPRTTERHGHSGPKWGCPRKLGKLGKLDSAGPGGTSVLNNGDFEFELR
jgi:hypothetical protein